MFSIQYISQILITTAIIIVWFIIFFSFRFKVAFRVEKRLLFLKRCEKLIKSGSKHLLSTDQTLEEYRSCTYTDFFSRVIQAVDSGIKASFQEEDKIIFLKNMIQKYLSFLKDKLYFFILFKSKVLISLIVVLFVRLVLLAVFGSKLTNYQNMDIFFVCSDLVVLLYLCFKYKNKIDTSVWENQSESKNIREWTNTYFYRAYCPEKLYKNDNKDNRKESIFFSKIKDFNLKEIKEGVSYTEDIQEFLQEWIEDRVSQEEKRFEKLVELFPLVELCLIGGSSFFLIVVPICSII